MNHYSRVFVLRFRCPLLPHAATNNAAPSAHSTGHGRGASANCAYTALLIVPPLVRDLPGIIAAGLTPRSCKRIIQWVMTSTDWRRHEFHGICPAGFSRTLGSFARNLSELVLQNFTISHTERNISILDLWNSSSWFSGIFASFTRNEISRFDPRSVKFCFWNCAICQRTSFKLQCHDFINWSDELLLVQLVLQLRRFVDTNVICVSRNRTKFRW